MDPKHSYSSVKGMLEPLITNSAGEPEIEFSDGVYGKVAFQSISTSRIKLSCNQSCDQLTRQVSKCYRNDGLSNAYLRGLIDADPILGISDGSFRVFP